MRKSNILFPFTRKSVLCLSKLPIPVSLQPSFLILSNGVGGQGLPRESILDLLLNQGLYRSAGEECQAWG